MLSTIIPIAIATLIFLTMVGGIIYMQERKRDKGPRERETFGPIEDEN